MVIANTSLKYSKKYLKYKSKYLLLKKQKQMLGGVPFKGKFVILFKHDKINDEFFKTLKVGDKTKLSDIKDKFLGAYALTSNRKKIKILNKSGIFTRIKNYIVKKISNKKNFKAEMKEKIIKNLKANNQPVDEKSIEKALANINITKELDNYMKKELTPIKDSINLDNSAEFIKLDVLLERPDFVERGINSYIVIDKGGNLFKNYNILHIHNSSPLESVIDINIDIKTDLQDKELEDNIKLFKNENKGDEIDESELNDQEGGWDCDKTIFKYICDVVFTILCIIGAILYVLVVGILFLTCFATGVVTLGTFEPVCKAFVKITSSK